MTDKTREAFEVWAERQGVSLKRVSERENATYTNYETYLAYQAWKDATTAQDARIRQLEEALNAICKRFPMDSDMEEAGWTKDAIDHACDVYEKARAALKDPS